MNPLRIYLIALLVLVVQLHAQQPHLKPGLSDFQFLLGDWTGEGGGNPGQGKGDFTFAMDLQDHIIIRRNRSEYPATAAHAAFSHTDLMVIYEEPGNPVRAIYFDNEGHTIRYNTALSGDGKSIVFTSDSSPAGPRFQLTYTPLSNDSLLITFEIAPPATPNTFSKYLVGKALRVHSSPAHSSEQKEK